MSMILWDVMICAIFILFAGVAYIIDDIFGVAIRAFFYKLTHKDGLPEGYRKGFIVGKPIRNRLGATVIVALISWYLLKNVFASTGPGILFLFLVSLLFTSIGFILGPWFKGIYSKKSKVAEVIEGIEKGEINIADESVKLAGQAAKGASKLTVNAGRAVGDALADAFAEAKKHVKKDEQPDDQSADEDAPEKETAADGAQEEAKPEDQEATEQDKARAGIDKFIKG